MQKSINSRSLNLLDRLNSVNLEKLAKQSGFYKRTPRKASVKLFTTALLYSAVSKHCVSLRKQALNMSLCGGITYSKQAFFKRLGPCTVEFLLKLLETFMHRHLTEGKAVTPPKGMASFKRVLIQDSTCIQLHASLAKLFPGARNQTSRVQSTLKIQATFDLLRHQLCAVSLSGFRRNDQAASQDILSTCEPGDLIIRDLGYFVLKIFRSIEHRGAWFISRYDTSVIVYDPDTQKPIHLLKHLRRAQSMDQIVLLGKKEKLPVRLVAVRMAESIANERRRKAKANRDRRCCPSKQKLALMGWNLFVTNLNSTTHNATFVAKAYAMRWRIETLFKAYKQHLALNAIQRGSSDYILVQVYAKLCWITATLHAFDTVGKEHSLSFIKFAEVIASIASAQLLQNYNAHTQTNRTSQMLYYCRYEKRNRNHFIQKLYALG